MKKVMKHIFKSWFSKFNILKNYMKFIMNLPFLPKIIKIEKVEQLVANLHDKTEQVMHIINLKQASNHGLVLKNIHRMIKFNQNAWLKPYTDMNRDLRKSKK